MLGSETAETNLRTLRWPCYLQLLGVDVGERDCGDESADAAVTMLFAAVGGRCWGARLRRRICGRCCYHAICSCWGYLDAAGFANVLAVLRGLANYLLTLIISKNWYSQIFIFGFWKGKKLISWTWRKQKQPNNFGNKPPLLLQLGLFW